MTSVVHCKLAPYDIYIGRPRSGAPLGWGNPFIIGPDGTREQVIQSYREWVVWQPHLMAALPDLKDKVLGCWCKTAANPQCPCHGDVLAELADSI